MRHLLAVGLLALVAGCGSQATSGEGDPAPTPTVVAIVHGPKGGGEVTATPTPVDTEERLADYLAQLRGTLPEEVRRAVEEADLADGQVPVAAVVVIGCDVPASVTVQADPLRVTAEPPAKPMQECFVEHTSVAVVGVDPELL